MGGVRFEIRTSMTARLLERCMEKGIPIERAEDADAHGFAAWVSDGDEARMRVFLDELHVPYRVRGAKGAARLKRFLRARAALLPALCVCAALLYLLSGRVWVISVTGADEAAIVGTLEEMGVRPGAGKRTLNMDAIGMALSAAHPEYAFFGVKAEGVCLSVRARRADEAPDVYALSDAGNLVADEDAVIVSISVTAGQARVKPGDTVKRGDVLIAGEERRTVDGETRPVAAAGRVVARTWTKGESETRDYAVQKRYTGRTRVKSGVETPFFTLSETDSDALKRFDAQTDSTDIVGLFVPVRVFQTLEREYEETRVPLNGDAAERAAFARALAAARSRAKADAQETKIRVQYDAPSEDTVRATVAVEWTQEITVKARSGS